MDEYSEVTRVLCSSTILLGKTFRTMLLEHLKQKYVAVAREIGLDARLLMQVVTYLENWDEQRHEIRRHFGWWFLGLAVILGILLATTRSLTLVLVVLFAVGGYAARHRRFRSLVAGHGYGSVRRGGRGGRRNVIP
jgi:hypothetical protein